MPTWSKQKIPPEENDVRVDSCSKQRLHEKIYISKLTLETTGDEPKQAFSHELAGYYQIFLANEVCRATRKVRK
jgi:hypothetical protein